jgi:hypothetical protein
MVLSMVLFRSLSAISRRLCFSLSLSNYIRLRAMDSDTF